MFATAIIAAINIVAAVGARAASEEEAYRRMLERGPAQEAPAAAKPSPDPKSRGDAAAGSSAPKPKVAKTPPPRGLPCDQEFANLHAKNDAGEKYYARICFVEDQCSSARKCELLRVQHSEYAKLAKLASSCRTLPDAMAWEAKYRKWVASGPETLSHFCGTR